MDLNNITSVIHNSQNADFKNYIYTKIYSSSDTEVTINSTSVELVKGTILNLRVYSTSLNPNVYLIGLDKNKLFPKNLFL